MKKTKIEVDLSVFDEKLNNILDAMSNFDEFISLAFDSCAKKTIDSFIYELPDIIFNKYCYATLNPQSYGSKFEERFRRKYNLKKVSAKLNSGDLTNNVSNFEFKVSIMTKTNPVVDIVQIRLDHNINYYIVQVIDARNPKECSSYAMLSLSKDQMKYECNLSGNNSAHGSAGLAGLRIDFKFGSETFNRFIKEYQFNNVIIINSANNVELA